MLEELREGERVAGDGVKRHLMLRCAFKPPCRKCEYLEDQRVTVLSYQRDCKGDFIGVTHGNNLRECLN
jgi:hypothetical protein